MSIAVELFEPILVPFVTIPDVLCRCFKAMLLVRFYPNRALAEVYRDVFNQGRLLLLYVNQKQGDEF